MLAASWGAITLQRCGIPQGYGLGAPGGGPGTKVGRTWPGQWGGVLHDAEGARGGPGALCGVGPPFLGPQADARQAHSEGGFGFRAHTSDGPHQCLAGVDKPTGSVGAAVGSVNV